MKKKVERKKNRNVLLAAWRERTGFATMTSRYPDAYPREWKGEKKGGVATSRVRALVRKENAVILESFTHNKGGPANPGGS